MMKNCIDCKYLRNDHVGSPYGVCDLWDLPINLITMIACQHWEK